MASRLPLLITCASLSFGAGAAELGEPRIGSFIGQPLAVELELTALASPATPVGARLANPNVYRGANIGMPPVLSTLSMGVTQRDGRQFLRVTSSAPVESSRLHLYLELADGSGRDVRLVTLLMAPNPNPPPAPVVVPAPVKAPMPAPVVVEAPPKPVPAPAPKAIPKPKPVPKPIPKPIPKPEPEPVAAPLPLPAPVAAPATCAPASSGAPSSVCAALDYKNAQLREQIGALEGKVRVLQVALGASPSAVAHDKPAAPASPRPARKRPAPDPDTGMPWGWIGGGVLALLALVAGVLLLLRRRKQARQIQPMPRVPLLARLRQRFSRKKTAPAPVEPQLDEPSKEMSTQL